MKFGVVISKKDKAGLNIGEHLKKLGIDFYLTEKKSIDENNADELVGDADFVIFATKHKSAKGNRSLTCHAPGNWRGADYGGRAGKVCKTSGLFLKLLFGILNDEAQKQGWEQEVSLECTHHGPYIEKPCCFIEIGSSEKDWGDKKAGEIIAKTIKRAMEEKVRGCESVIGIGGPHYCPNFSKIQLNSKYAVGHVIPNYVFPLTSEMVDEALDGMVEKVRSVVVDWKGCGRAGEREEAINLLRKKGLEVLRSDKIKKEDDSYKTKKL